MQIFLVLALIIALIAVVFTIQNTALVTVTFLFWDLNQSLAFVVLLAILSGVLISQFVSVPGKVKRTMENNNQKKKIKELDSELMSTKVRLEALKQELEIYHNQVGPSAGEITPRTTSFFDQELPEWDQSKTKALSPSPQIKNSQLTSQTYLPGLFEGYCIEIGKNTRSDLGLHDVKNVPVPHAVFFEKLNFSASSSCANFSESR